MNCYEEAELETRDLTCDICDTHLSVHDYYEFEGLCESCWFESAEEENGGLPIFSQ